MNYTTSMEVANLDLVNKRVTLRVASQTIGTDGIIILASAWDRDIGDYQANPVLCWGHPLKKGRTHEPEDALGKAYNDEQPAIRTEPDGLWMTFQYAADVNPKAARVWEMTAAGYLRAFSVYWIPLEEVTCGSGRGAIDALPAFAREALLTGAALAVHTRVKLLEVSEVIVGGDPTALTAARDAGLISEEEFRERSATMSTNPKLEEDKSASAVPPPQAHGRMPVAMKDMASRLRNAADCIEMSRWYDGDASCDCSCSCLPCCTGNCCLCTQGCECDCSNLDAQKTCAAVRAVLDACGEQLATCCPCAVSESDDAVAAGGARAASPPKPRMLERLRSLRSRTQ